MDSIDGVKKKRPRRTLNLCRICLTYSPSMREMTEIGCGILTIQEILAEVMCCEIMITQKSPNQICSVCLSILKISYDFKNQFEDSQKKLFGNLNEKRHESEIKASSEVELIIGNNNFSLDDVVIVENDEKEEDYSQLLNNLGKTVTVEYLKKPSLKGHTNEQLYDAEYKDSPEIISAVELMNDEFEDNEDYETIIIEYVSDDEEKFLNPDDSTQCSSDVKKFRNSSPLGKIIDSLIIEGDGTEQREVQCSEIENSINERDENGSSRNDHDFKPTRKKKDRVAEMKEIEKYIIYGTGEERKQDHNIQNDSLALENKNNSSVLKDDEGNHQNNTEKNDNVSLNQYILYNSTGSSKKLKDKHVCENCLISFDTPRVLKRHLVSVHGIEKGEKPRKRITKKLPREVRMIRRIQKLKERYKENPMLCQICGYVSRSSGGARYHSLTHGEKNYKCDVCPKKFFTPNHLKNHLHYKHEKKTSKHLCSVCGEYRNSSTALIYHMKLHTNDSKRYSCPICDITFLMKSGLTTHIRRHLGDRRFPCNKCEKSFFSANERKKHMMVHTGEKPHKCKYCVKRFGSRFNQKVHMMTHSGPYLCKVCLRGFVSEEILQLHLKYRHCTSSKVETAENQKTVDEDEKYDKYELLIKKSPGSCSDDVVLEDLSLLDAAEEDVLEFEDED